MSFIKIDIEEIRNSKNFDEIITILRDGIENHLEWEGKTKAELVKIAAEKLLEAGYPAIEIKDLIVERLEGQIKEHYVRQCLDERFKKASSIAAGKKAAEAKKLQAMTTTTITNTGSSSSTVMEEQEPSSEHKSDGNDADYEGDDFSISKKAEREQLPDIKPQLESESEGKQKTQQQQQQHEQQQSRYSEEYVSSLEEQIKALNGDLPYSDCLATLRLVKIDKVTENRILNASRASKSHVYLYVDIRSNEVREIYTDTEYLKKVKTEQKAAQA